nr:amyloid beta A4 precursor protein-binding family A member 2-like [Aotus nancymaae]
MDCNGEEYLAHTACTPWTPTGARRPSVEEWTESAGPHPQGHRAEGSQDYLEGYLPIPEFEPSVLEARDQEEDGPHRLSKEGYQDYYPAEANENTGASPYCLRCGDGDLEDQEQDIDRIMAAIKMSLSMMSITSASEASLEHGLEPGPGDSAEACLASRAPAGTRRGPSHCQPPFQGQAPRRSPERLQAQHQDPRGEAKVAPRAGGTLAVPEKGAEGPESKEPPGRGLADAEARGWEGRVPCSSNGG